MEIYAIEVLSREKTQEIVKASSYRDLTSDELLRLKSRTFHFPIQMLELTMGDEESNKREIVTIVYNNLRFVDTGEDADPQKMNSQTKIKTIDTYVDIFNQARR